VLWDINAHFHGNRQKLGPHWVGPYEITAVYHDEQSFDIKIIPKKGSNKRLKRSHNRNNKKQIDRLSHHKHSEIFSVPRSQLKPYYDSFEAERDGLDSPLTISIDELNKSNSNLIEQRSKIENKIKIEKEIRDIELNEDDDIKMENDGNVNLSNDVLRCLESEDLR
jgi:hypothetical protein